MATMFENQSMTEGSVARAIESQTAKLPSDVFLWAACGSILGSLVLQMTGRKEDALFVGQWAPTFLILGLYNKLVKIEGHDRESRTEIGGQSSLGSQSGVGTQTEYASAGIETSDYPAPY